jgi:hypothetical protein
MKVAKPRSKLLYDAALAEREPLLLRTRLRAAEVAMTRAAQLNLNSKEGVQEYEELIAAMRALYENALRHGMNVSGGTFNSGQ